MLITETGLAAVNKSITRHRPVKRDGDQAICQCGSVWTLNHLECHLLIALGGRGTLTTTHTPWEITRP